MWKSKASRELGVLHRKDLRRCGGERPGSCKPEAGFNRFQCLALLYNPISSSAEAICPPHGAHGTGQDQDRSADPAGELPRTTLRQRARARSEHARTTEKHEIQARHQQPPPPPPLLQKEKPFGDPAAGMEREASKTFFYVFLAKLFFGTSPPGAESICEVGFGWFLARFEPDNTTAERALQAFDSLQSVLHKGPSITSQPQWLFVAFHEWIRDSSKVIHLEG